MQIEKVHFDQAALAAVCRQYGVKRLSLFGSSLRDDFGPNSDVDVLVEFGPDASPSLLDLGGLQQELSLLAEREIDLKTPGFLSRYFRDRVLAEAQVLYAA